MPLANDTTNDGDDTYRSDESLVIGVTEATVVISENYDDLAAGEDGNAPADPPPPLARVYKSHINDNKNITLHVGSPPLLSQLNIARKKGGKYVNKRWSFLTQSMLTRISYFDHGSKMIFWYDNEEGKAILDIDLVSSSSYDSRFDIVLEASSTEVRPSLTGNDMKQDDQHHDDAKRAEGWSSADDAYVLIPRLNDNHQQQQQQPHPVEGDEDKHRPRHYSSKGKDDDADDTTTGTPPSMGKTRLWEGGR
ncbi:hypothetical protein FOZ63_004218 [Perkinsus olseni]|uniref:Uncharacterized protein n=1 Tax=Perkinsus olseni TaxID=32597 RepID=A0A7J6QDV3_PEROL|nr:hypothetical protein FOZ63_004218 [Perkinsus olseni]